MIPTISPGTILFVDTAASERGELNQKITVVSHRDLGFKLAWLQRLAHSDGLVSSNCKYLPLNISNCRSGRSSARCCGGFRATF